MNGRHRSDTVKSGDVESIDIEKGNSRGDRHVIAIRLRSGARFRSADITGEDQAAAVRAEIIRRLAIEAQDHAGVNHAQRSR